MTDHETAVADLCFWTGVGLLWMLSTYYLFWVVL